MSHTGGPKQCAHMPTSLWKAATWSATKNTYSKSKNVFSYMILCNCEGAIAMQYYIKDDLMFVLVLWNQWLKEKK